LKKSGMSEQVKKCERVVGEDEEGDTEEMLQDMEGWRNRPHRWEEEIMTG